jgi:hypothetical protein
MEAALAAEGMQERRYTGIVERSQSGMTKREKIRETRLAEIESEFRPLLPCCLQECAHGRWGLFGQNDHLDPDGRYLGWPEARRLRDLAQEMQSIRLEFGQTDEICERFIQLCSQRGSNVPGEPRLAAEFLSQIGQN